MTKVENYEKLQREMKNATNNLNSAKLEIDNLIYKLNQGLKINDSGYRTSDLEDMKNKLDTYCNILNKTILPSIEDKLEELDEDSEEE